MGLGYKGGDYDHTYRAYCNFVTWIEGFNSLLLAISILQVFKEFITVAFFARIFLS